MANKVRSADDIFLRSKHYYVYDIMKCLPISPSPFLFTPEGSEKATINSISMSHRSYSLSVTEFQGAACRTAKKLNE